MARKARQPKKKPPEPTDSPPPTPINETLDRLASSLRIGFASDLPERPAAELPPQPQEVIPHLERAPVRSHIERLQGYKFDPVPKGFLNLDSYPGAGLKLNRTPGNQTVAVQFADDARATREGLGSEVETLRLRGFQYKPERKSWERTDPENPTGNLIDAKELANSLANARLGRGR